MDSNICAQAPFIQHTFPRGFLLVRHCMRYQKNKDLKSHLPWFLKHLQSNKKENSNGIFHKKREKHSAKICTEPQKIPNSQSTLEKEEQGWSYHNSCFWTIEQSYRIKTYWHWHRNRPQATDHENRVREPRNKLMHIRPPDFWQGHQEHTTGKEESAVNWVSTCKRVKWIHISVKMGP